MTYSNPMPAAPVYGNYSPLSPMGTQYIQQPQAAPAPQVPLQRGKILRFGGKDPALQLPRPF